MKIQKLDPTHAKQAAVLIEKTFNEFVAPTFTVGINGN